MPATIFLCGSSGIFRLETAEFYEQRRVRLQPYIAASPMRCSRCPPARIARPPYGRSSISIAPNVVTSSRATALRSARARNPNAASLRATGAWRRYGRHGHQLADEAVLSAGDRGAGKGADHSPYLFGYRPKFCVTLSYALSLNGSYHVLCVDLDFAALAGDDLASVSPSCRFRRACSRTRAGRRCMMQFTPCPSSGRVIWHTRCLFVVTKNPQTCWGAVSHVDLFPASSS